MKKLEVIDSVAGSLTYYLKINKDYTYACKQNLINELEKFIVDNKINKYIEVGYGLHQACEHGHYQIVERLMQVENINFKLYAVSCIRYAALNNNSNILKMLLADKRTPTGLALNDLVYECLKKQYHHSITVLLNSDKVMYNSVTLEHHIKRALEIRLNEKILISLVNNNKFEPLNNTELMKRAVALDMPNLLQAILKHEKTQVSFYNNVLLENAIDDNNIKIVLMLLQDKRLTMTDEFFLKIFDYSILNKHVIIWNLLILYKASPDDLSEISQKDIDDFLNFVQ